MPFSLHGPMKFLADFLNQAHTGELKVVGRYPTEFAGLRVRVSFGQGIPAHIPWIAFLADDMKVRDGYYPNYLYYKKNKSWFWSLVLAKRTNTTGNGGQT